MTCDYNASAQSSSTFAECEDARVNRGNALYETERMYFNLVVSTVICTVVSIFGIVSNALNMAVFSKMGFKDSINMSLFALAISDFGSCLFLIPCVVGSFPWNTEFGVPVAWIQVAHTTGAWPHVACTKITTLITAFITVERCLCVFLPLKVKTIITRKRTIAYLIFSFSFVGALLIPVFYCNQLGWRFDARHNASVLGLIFPKEREDIERVIIPIINAFLSVSAFIFIIIATALLVVTLNKQSKWRLQSVVTTSKTDKPMKNEKSKSRDNNDDSATKEKAISKMVVIISTLFIASLLPSTILIVALWLDRRFDIGGTLNNLFIIMVNITYTLEGVNAALNIIVYYKNSSNYKTMFDTMFRSKRKTVS